MLKKTTTCALCIFVAFLMIFSSVLIIGAAKSSVSNRNVVYLSGTPEEIGMQSGLVLQKEIRANLATFWSIAEAQGLSRSNLVRVAQGQILPAEIHDELKAVSRAADVDYGELLAFNVFGSSILGAACTCFVARGDVTLNHDPLSFKTMDWYGLANGVNEVLVIVKPETGNSYMGINVAGAVGLSSQGMNDKGLSIGYNWLPVPSYYNAGLTPWEMQELVLEKCSSVTSAISLVSTLPKHEGVNLMVSDKGESAFIETAPSIYSPNVSYRIITSGYAVHTNHWMYEPFFSWVLDQSNGWAGQNMWTGSVSRYDRAMALGSEYAGSLTPTLLMSFTRDLTNWGCTPQDVIAAHPEWASVLQPGWPGNSICNAMTRSACVFEFNRASPTILSTMWMADGNPCYTPYVPLHSAVFYNSGTMGYATAQLSPYMGKAAYQLSDNLKSKYQWGQLVPTYAAWEAGIIGKTANNEAQAQLHIKSKDLAGAANLLTAADCSIALQALSLQSQLAA